MTATRLLLLGPPGAADSAIPLTLAIQRTQLFHRFYQHALDFDELRLLDDWRRCRHPADPAACARGLEFVGRLAAGERLEALNVRAGGR